jgi:very-short-patch-repair endonuclease
MKFRRQHGIGPYIVDFYCPERAVVIEVDGDNHAETRQMIKDREREGYIRALGLRIIRYTNDDVLTNLEGVMEYLVKELAEQSTSPGPSLSRGGADRSSLRSSP